jgi:transposase
VTAVLMSAVAGLAAQVKALEVQIGVLLAAHPDAGVFTSLPRSGMLRAARLPAETGGCRARDPQSLAATGGVSPVTRQSGKCASHGFRWSANRELRDALCDFAGDSRPASARAAEIYGAARARGKDHPHAVRITACAWVPVIWRCWRDGVPCDPAKHRALQDILARQAGKEENR